MKAKIKVGAWVFQDFSNFHWKEEDKDIIFDVEKASNGYSCTAFGFGDLKTNEGYGNGRIYVYKKSDLILVKPIKNKTNEQTALYFVLTGILMNGCMQGQQGCKVDFSVVEEAIKQINKLFKN